MTIPPPPQSDVAERLIAILLGFLLVQAAYAALLIQLGKL